LEDKHNIKSNWNAINELRHSYELMIEA
jgi:hypothetical protein